MNETLDVFLFLTHFIQKINLSGRSRPKLSETIDQGIKLWWLSYEGSMRPCRGRLTPKMAWSAPPGRSGMIVNLLLRLVFVHKTPVGNFSQGWWWLSWVHQITAMADRTNYASICSALPGYILTWKRSSVFFWRGKLHREENISFSDERQMQAVAKSNFRSKKVLKEVVARYIAILVLECFHSDIP